MATTDFAHLHLHTQYSFLDGAIRVKDLVNRAVELGMPHVAVTDHGNMFGAVDFYQQAQKAGVKPILGIEAYVTGKAKHTDKVRENYHMVLLAENDIGYDNLRKLTTTSFLHGKYYFPRIDKQLLREHSEGVIALTACLGGEVGKKCAQDKLDEAREAVREFKDIFGPDHFFMEVQPNGIPIQNKVNADVAQLAADEGLKLVVTNDCHYVHQDEHEAQNILMAIRQQKAFDDPTLHKHETAAFYIRSGQEMWDLTKSEFASGFENACEIAKRCNVNLDLGNTYLPPFPHPAKYTDEGDFLVGLSKQGLEKRFTEINYPVDRDEYFARLKVELDIIIQMGFPGYFLIVQDFINWSKQNGIRVGPGRGSGAGSLVAWALRITDIDPLPYNLLFERFLNPERVSMPDFDVDFMQARRGEVIQYVAEKYGRDHVGQIATYSGLNPKSAIKDVARTLGVGFTEINELTKPIPVLLKAETPEEKKMHPLDLALKHAPELRALGETDELYGRVIKNARTLVGLYRQAGMHAGGVVIGEKPLVDYVPLFQGNNGELVTQFDKDKVEAAGLVKFDFLGLKTLDLVDNAERLVNERVERENRLFEGEERDRAAQKHPHLFVPDLHGNAVWNPGDAILPIDVEKLTLDNAEIYKLISSGDTMGVFQVESSGFQEMCRQLKPDCFEDIVAAVALYRPGPMDAGMTDDFILRKHGKKKIEYPHPSLEEVLEPTYGTFVYQEQVMQAAQVLANYSLGGADLLRRAMGKKKLSVMQEQRKIFAKGALENDISEERSMAIFDTIEKFAGYGFNKSHSAAYALITYHTGYLKKFYPVEFMAALLTIESGSTENVVKYINEARNMGVKVLAPDINISERSFSVDYEVSDEDKYRRKKRDTGYGYVRFGLGAVKGLGDSALNAILETRREEGPFKSIYHFCEKVPLKKINKKVLEILVKAGAFDCFGKTRSQIHAVIERALEAAQAVQKDARTGQTNMFAAFTPANSASSVEEVYPNLNEWPEKELLGYERQSVGFYLSGHPLDRYAEDVKKLGAIPTVELTKQRHNGEAKVVGIVVAMKERILKSGNGRWAVVTIEDNFGQAEVLCFSKAFEEGEAALKSGEPVLIEGRALLDDIDDEGVQRQPKMRGQLVRLLSEVQIERTHFVQVNFEAPRKKGMEEAELTWKNGVPADDLVDLDETKKLLATIEKAALASPGEKPLEIAVELPGGVHAWVRADEKYRVHPDDELLLTLERLHGVKRVMRR